MAGHSSPSARHLARHWSISYGRGQAAVGVGQERGVGKDALQHGHGLRSKGKLQPAPAD